MVSQNPLDPSEPPMVPTKIPSGAIMGADERRRGELREPSLTKDPIQENDQATESRPGFAVTSNSIKSSFNFAADTAETRSAGDQEGDTNPAETWAHICACLGKDYPMPTGEGARSLLRLPRVRPLQLDPAITTPLNDRQIMAVLIYMTGVKWNAPCTNCRRSPPPFHACVRLERAMVDDPHVVDALRSLKRCCANCIIGSTPHSCSIKNRWAAAPPNAAPVAESWLHQGRVDSSSDADEDDEVPAPNLRKRRRRSPSPSEEPPLKRNVVTTRANPDALTGAATSTPTGAGAASTTVQISRVVPQEEEQDILDMEDWELEQGHISPAIASSSTGRMSPSPNPPPQYHY